ncbi:hypothetical protein ONZ51_g13320 [Trametes cubensis]|uniref:Uncharacterized protein n=1 Tax=Trametes cubensis TaxID=1111947 RepID=A0AAD7X472_9APHY|nr:hypothetical protein ONZ51_g13320 [Trametes cubensis]
MIVRQFAEVVLSTCRAAAVTNTTRSPPRSSSALCSFGLMSETSAWLATIHGRARTVLDVVTALARPDIPMHAFGSDIPVGIDLEHQLRFWSKGPDEYYPHPYLWDPRTVFAVRAAQRHTPPTDDIQSLRSAFGFLRSTIVACFRGTGQDGAPTVE